MKLKRLVSAFLTAAVMFTAVSGVLPVEEGQNVIKAQAAVAAGESKLTSRQFIAKACRLVGKSYQLGGKGCYSFSGGFLTPSQIHSIDCSGLVFWSLGSLGVKAKSPIRYYAASCVLPLNTVDWYDSTNVWRTNYGRFVYKSQQFRMKKERCASPKDYTATKSKKELVKRQSYWLARGADGKLKGYNVSQGSVIIARSKYKSTGCGDDHAFIYIGEFDSKAELRKYLTETLKVKVPDKYIVEKKHNMADGSTSKNWRIESSGSFGGVYINNGVTDEDDTYSFEAYSLTQDDTLVIRQFYNGQKMTAGDKDHVYFTVKSGKMYMQAKLRANAQDEEYFFTGWTSDESKATKFVPCECSKNAYGAKINKIPHSDSNYKVTQYVTSLAKKEGISDSPDGVRVFFAGKNGYDASQDTALGGYDKNGVYSKSITLGTASWSKNSISKINFAPEKLSPKLDDSRIYVDFNNSRPRSDDPNDLANAVITIDKNKYTYTGSEIKPETAVTLGKKTLVQGRDYTLRYSKNTSAGIAFITAEGVGEYTGTGRKCFRIEKAQLKKAKVISAPDSRICSGEALTPIPKLSYKGKELKAGVDFEVTYTNNKSVGTANMLIKGIGSFKGTLKHSFKIIPPACEIRSAEALGSGAVKVKCKKTEGITGYQVICSTSKDFSKNKTSILSDKASIKLKGLKKGKPCYIKVRTYKTVGGEKYFGCCSEAVKVRVK